MSSCSNGDSGYMAGDSIAVAAVTGVRWDEDGRGERARVVTKGKNDQHAVFRVQCSVFSIQNAECSIQRECRKMRGGVEGGR